MSSPLPSVDAAAAGPSRRTIRRIGAATFGLLFLAAGVALLGPGPDGFPLDPRSADDDGLLGVVELLGELDVRVDVAARAPSDTDIRVFVPVDQMTGDQRAGLVAFAEDGGTVVVAGASPAIHGLELLDGGFEDVFGRTSRTPDCDALSDVGEVFHDRWTPIDVPDGAVSCFPITGIGAWLVAVPTGSGTIVALGSAEPFTNGLLGDEDNAALAVSLLGPEPGDRLRIVPRGEVGEGETPMVDLIPAGVVRAGWLLLAALLAGVLWRARRLGPPVAERLPPVLPSAELARSVADLLQRAGDRTAAAGRIREDVRQEVRRSLRLPVGTPSARLIELVPSRSGVAPADARLVLLDAPVDHDRELRDLAAAAARMRVGLRRPAPSTSPSDPSPVDPPLPSPSPDRSDP